MFELDIGKWDQWKDFQNGKYLIPYDDSDLRKKTEEETLRIALEAIEFESNLKFVKYDPKTCSKGEPCS